MINTQRPESVIPRCTLYLVDEKWAAIASYISCTFFASKLAGSSLASMCTGSNFFGAIAILYIGRQRCEVVVRRRERCEGGDQIHNTVWGGRGGWHYPHHMNPMVISKTPANNLPS